MNENLRFHDTNGNCLARDNIVIAFFRKCPFADMVEGAKYCVDQYLQMIPTDVLHWSVIGASADTYKPLTEKSLARCRSMLTAVKARQKNIHFRLLGHEKYGPDYGVVLDGNKIPSNEGFLDQTNVIEMRFPREFLNENSEDAFVAIVTDLFENMPCDSGYASVSLCFGKESRYAEAGAQITPLALRSHGFDIPNNLSTGGFLGNHCRGARWLTMLSNELINELGGNDSLTEKLLDGVEIINTTHGVVLRAGRSPEIGDVNRNQTTPLLASVAHAIEAVTYFGDPSLRPLFGHDAEKQNRWERRFWPDT